MYSLQNSFPSSSDNIKPDKQYKAIKQQYINADTVGLSNKLSSPSSSHKPIPIQNIFEAIHQQLLKKRTQTANSSSLPLLHPNSSSSSAYKTLDGFFLLKMSNLDYPDNVISVNVSDQKLSNVVEEDLTYFSNLQYLDASDNALDISLLRYLPALQELRLTCNSISNISSINILSEGFDNLSVLDLSYNHINPESIINLSGIKSLRVLDLSGNGLMTLPTDMFEFEYLDKLLLNNNKFENDNIFVILSYIPNIRHINLAYNYLSKVLHDSCSTEDQFRWLESVDLSFNYISEEDSIMPILAPRKIKEVILYGNPVLGPTGEDPLQIRIENLVEAALLPSNFGREHAVDVITDIPRENIPKKGHLVGRQARYRDFTMKEIKTEKMKSNRQWRQEGNQSIFAEAMAMLRKVQSAPGSLLTSTANGDAFFITEVENIAEHNKQVTDVASNVLDGIADELKLNENEDLTVLHRQVEIVPVLVPTLLAEDKMKNDSHDIHRYDEIDMPSIKAIQSTLEKSQAIPDPSDSFELIGGYKDMALRTAMNALRFAVDHPVTNYYEVPAKGFLPPSSHVQPNQAYKHRKIKKYEPAEIVPPLVVSAFPSNSKRHAAKIGRKLPPINRTKIASPLNRKYSAKNDLGTKKDRPVEDVMQQKTFDQIDQVLSGLNKNSAEFVTKPLGHGQNLKENIEALQSFVRPHNALNGLSTLVDTVIE